MKCKLQLEHGNIINEGPGRRGSSVEAEHIVTLSCHCDLEELVVAKPRTDRLYGYAVPLHIDERGLLLRGRRERACLEEADAVLPSRERREGLRRRERARECIIGVRRSEQRHRVPGVRERLEEEDRRVVGATRRARADPVGVLRVETEFVTFVKVLEATINDEVGALVPAGEGHLKVALAGVDGGRGVRGDEVLFG